jgi:chromosome segregation ATPase
MAGCTGQEYAQHYKASLRFAGRPADHRPSIGARGTTLMPIEMLTYADLGHRLNVSPEAARAIAKRMRLPRSRANDGKALVSVDLAEIQHKALPARSPGGHQAVIPFLKTKIETLEKEIARLEGVAAGHRADFEHERARADALMAEVLNATADTMAAKEATAWLEGELTALRSIPDTREAEIARLDAVATAHRADFERERARANALTEQVLKGIATIAEFESRLARLKSRPWWKRFVA